MCLKRTWPPRSFSVHGGVRQDTRASYPNPDAQLLLNADKHVQELQDALGVERPVVSQPLAVLRADNIVAGRKEGVSPRNCAIR